MQILIKIAQLCDKLLVFILKFQLINIVDLIQPRYNFKSHRAVHSTRLWICRLYL